MRVKKEKERERGRGRRFEAWAEASVGKKCQRCNHPRYIITEGAGGGGAEEGTKAARVISSTQGEPPALRGRASPR